MRKCLLVIALTLLFFFSAKPQIVLRKDTIISIKNIGNVVIPKNSKIVLDSLGNVIAFYPQKAIRLGDYLVKPYSRVELYPQGSLKQLVPLQDEKFFIAGHQVIAPAQFPITFHPDGQIDEIYLKNDLEWQQNGFKAVFKAGSYVKFYSNGQLKMGLLKYPTQVLVEKQPVVLKADRPIIFYPDGRFKSGFVWIPVSLIDAQGKKVKIEQNQFLQVDKKGKLMR